MFRKSFIITILVLVGLSTAAAVSASMHSQRKGMSCMGDMMGMGEMEGMADIGREERTQQSLTEGRKKVGEEFTCPIDGMRMTVTENTPATEYRGKIYYFCSEEDKQTFLQDPERYVKRQSSR